MSLGERIERTRATCEAALAGPGLADAARFLARRGVTDEQVVALLRDGARRRAAPPELRALHAAFMGERGGATGEATGERDDAEALQRALLTRAALGALPQIGALPVDESVKHLFCREFAHYAEPPASARGSFSLDGMRYFAMARITVLERFPGGASHWESSGFPRSWLAKIAPRHMARVLRFLALEARGLQPFFFGHLGDTRTAMPFLVEREFRLAFWRTAAALERQPAIRGMMAGSWLHSQETHRVSPHLAFLNTAWFEAGAVYADRGAADPADGFLNGSKEREELYRDGRYRPTFGLVMCSRAHAIAWKRAHPELEEAALAIR